MIAIYLSQLMDCEGFSVIVTIAPCEHLHWILHNPVGFIYTKAEAVSLQMASYRELFQLYVYIRQQQRSKKKFAFALV